METPVFIRAKSYDDVFDACEKHTANYALIAGGTDILPAMRGKKISPAALISLKDIFHLSAGITVDADRNVIIPSCTTLEEVHASDIIKKSFPALSLGTENIGSLQIRNMATIGGNICNASPAADSVTPLLIYNAKVKIKSIRGSCIENISDFIIGPNKTLLKTGEVLEHIILPYHEERRSFFIKLGRRRALDLSIVNLSTLIDKEWHIRIGVGAAAPVPFRAKKAENLISDIRHENSIDIAAQKTSEESSPIGDQRASREYRLAMVRALTAKALRACM
jgi:carbon-monoxide dehydrogenase medium subunit